MATNIYSEEQLNYFRVCHIATDELPQALRVLFKQEWDNRYQATYGEWKDTPQNGVDFKNGESPATQRKNARLLATMANGNRTEWDCTMLFYAILYSDCIGRAGLSPVTRSNVDALRKFRNEDFAHAPVGQLSNGDFSIAVGKVETTFRALGLSIAKVQELSKQTSFPTNELQNVTAINQKLLQELQEKDAELQENKDKLQTTEELRKVLEEQLNNEAKPFCVFPPRPPHQIESRDCDVAKITQELANLKKVNPNSLSYCYVSGNPGSGKSQLAGLVAKNFYEKAMKNTSVPSFVMTLNAENSEGLFTSYTSLARKMSCSGYTIDHTESSRDLKIERKISIIRDLIANKIHLFSSWLLVIDNVTNLSTVGAFLPELGNEQWGKGQLLITTQDCSCIPPDSSCTSHISISKGMDPADAIRLLAEVSGITTDHCIGRVVANALDYQPLALASAGVYVRKVRNTNSTFGWKGFSEKLEKGMRKGTEEYLARMNNVYPNSMTASVAIAVKAAMDSDEIMKSTFTFLALCAPEPLSLDLLTSYVVKVNGDLLDIEKIGIRIQDSSLLIIETGDFVNIRLHKVVYDIINLLVEDRMKAVEHSRAVCVAVKSCEEFVNKTPIRKQLPSFDSVTEESRHIIPHLKTISVKIKNILFTEDKFQVFKSANQVVKMSSHNFQVLGRICRLHGEYLLGIDYFTTALKLIEDDETINSASIYVDMGNLHDVWKSHQKAMECYERALSIQLDNFGPEHPDIARTYNNIGLVQGNLGNYQQAKDYYERSLSIKLKKLGPFHVAIADTYHNMGIIHRQLGDYQQAKEYYERALSIEQNKLGPDHLNVAVTYHNMGKLHTALGDYQQAKEYYERALSIKLSKLGPDHFSVGRTYNGMGDLHHHKGDHQQAKEYYERARFILNNYSPK